jgi:uncharacterized caspase-like protein
MQLRFDDPVSRFRRLSRQAAWLALAVLQAGCAIAPREAGYSARLALVIGNGAYENAPPLRNPINDANDMCSRLRKLRFKTMCHTDLRSRADFEVAVKRYVDELGPNSVGVVYYSGHGVQAGGANFLIPTQVHPRSATESPLRVLYGLDDLFSQLRTKPTILQFVVLDACRTDLFSQAAPPQATRGALVRSLETVARAKSGLAPIQDAPAGTMVLYATAAKEAAFAGKGRNGPLTKHVLLHIGTSGLPLEKFIKNVTAGVINETQSDYESRMTPYIYGSFSGEFCFAGCGGPGGLPTPAN